MNAEETRDALNRIPGVKIPYHTMNIEDYVNLIPDQKVIVPERKKTIVLQ